MIREEAKNLQEGEPPNLVAHSHGGNVVKYASEEFKNGELDNVIFLDTPHREDAKFNQQAMKQGGKVVNVYDERDFVQGFWGKSDIKGLTEFKFKDLHLFAPNPKQTIPNAINIKVKQPNGASSMFGTKDETSPHSIHTTRKWNDFVKTKLEDKQ